MPQSVAVHPSLPRRITHPLRGVASTLNCSRRGLSIALRTRLNHRAGRLLGWRRWEPPSAAEARRVDVPWWWVPWRRRPGRSFAATSASPSARHKNRWKCCVTYEQFVRARPPPPPGVTPKEGSIFRSTKWWQQIQRNV